MAEDDSVVPPVGKRPQRTDEIELCAFILLSLHAVIFSLMRFLYAFALLHAVTRRLARYPISR